MTSKEQLRNTINCCCCDIMRTDDGIKGAKEGDPRDHSNIRPTHEDCFVSKSTQ